MSDAVAGSRYDEPMTISGEWHEDGWKLTIKVGGQETDMETGELVLKEPEAAVSLRHDQWLGVVSTVLQMLKGKQDPDSDQYVLGPHDMNAYQTAAALGDILEDRWR